MCSKSAMDLEEDEEMNCCEYLREDGEVRHVLQCFCECNDLDSLADDCIKCCCEGQRLQGPALREKLRRVCWSCAERFRMPWPGGAVEVPWPGAWAALLVLWALRRLLELSTWLPWVAGWLLLGFGHLLLIHLMCLALPMRSEYLVAWVFFSIMGLYGDYSREVWPNQALGPRVASHLLLLEVVVTFGASVALKPKKDEELSAGSFPCRICGRSIHGRDHHCVWINQCVGTHNHRSFLLFLLGLTLLSWSYARMLCFGEGDPRLMEFARRARLEGLGTIWQKQRVPPPLEGAVYAAAGGIFTMVLLLAQVVSISTGLTNQRRGLIRSRNWIQNWILWIRN
ncbi:unnamed protein product [Durusdinium trenchii]|uniref:Palmitoyltransferase n=1 Tax=Durusdinium trenchii TaxID=1381693 RepID=A0ABP0KZ47_9DINO